MRFLHFIILLSLLVPAYAYSIDSIPWVAQKGRVKYDVSVSGLSINFPSQFAIAFDGYVDLGNGTYKMRFTFIYPNGNKTAEYDRNFEKYPFVYDEDDDDGVPFFDPDRTDDIVQGIKELQMQVTEGSKKIDISGNEFSIKIVQAQNSTHYIELRLAEKAGFVAYLDYRVSILGINVEVKLVAIATNIHEPTLVEELKASENVVVPALALIAIISALILFLRRRRVFIPRLIKYEKDDDFGYQLIG